MKQILRLQLKRNLLLAITTLFLSIFVVGSLTARAASGLCNINSITDGCWIDLTQFINTEYDYTDPATGKHYTASSDPDSARNIGVAASFNSVGSMVLNQDCSASATSCSGYTVSGLLGLSSFAGAAVPDYWTSVKMGYYRSPAYPNTILFSKMQSPNYLPEIFRYDTSNVNSMYVLSEPRFTPNEWASYFQMPGASVYFADRGYFWNFTYFPVHSVGGGTWRGPAAPNALSGGLTYNLGGYKAPIAPSSASSAAGYWLQQPVIEGHVTIFQNSYADFIPAGSDWYNYQPVGVLATQAGPGYPKTGNLPSDLNVVVVTTEGLDASGLETWMERYYYGVRTNGDAFGMIGYEGFILDTSICPTPWTQAYAWGVCWGQSYRQTSFQFNHLKQDGEYTTFIDAGKGNYTMTTNSDFFHAQLAKLGLQVQDPKLVARKPNSGTVVGDPSRPNLRGAFAAPGPGGDYNTKPITPGQIIGLEENLLVQDFYIYAAGTDIYADPVSQCRQGYSFKGSLVVDEVWSGLDRSDRKEHTWAIICGTATDAIYLGGSSCAPGYVERGYFLTAYDAYVSEAPNSVFHYQAPNNWINLCVKPSQAILTGDLGS